VAPFGRGAGEAIHLVEYRGHLDSAGGQGELGPCPGILDLCEGALEGVAACDRPLVAPRCARSIRAPDLATASA
jgi:hypothetical protein